MGVAARPSLETSEVEVVVCGLRQLEAPLLPDCLSLFAVHAPVKEFLGGVNVLAILSDSARVHDVLVGVARYGANNLYATKAIDVGGVYKGNINIARLSMLANVANRGVGYNLVVGAVRAAFTGDFLAGFACVITSGSVNANGGKGLCCIVACWNRVIANADGVLSGGNVIKLIKHYIGETRAFLRNHNQIILEQVYAGSLEPLDAEIKRSA